MLPHDGGELFALMCVWRKTVYGYESHCQCNASQERHYENLNKLRIMLDEEYEANGFSARARILNCEFDNYAALHLDSFEAFHAYNETRFWEDVSRYCRSHAHASTDEVAHAMKRFSRLHPPDQFPLAYLHET